MKEAKQTAGTERQNLVGVAVAAILAGIPLCVSVSAQAQEKTAAPDLEEVTVTGSRIVRRDLVANSPLVTVDTTALETKSGLNIESYLNQLPAFNPAASPVTTYNDVQISAVNSVGVSTISLRGFGPNRSLVLVNGHRPTPINALMVTDINEIPSSMIKRIEIISGGASATYGADAIGGVTNFILRDDFQGVETDVQRAQTDAGDGGETRAYAMMGTKIGEGRGNITLSAEYYRRDEALRRNRDFYTNAWSDPNTPTADLFVFGYNGYSTGFNVPNPNALAAIFPERSGRDANGNPTNPRVLPVGPGFISSLRFNSDGTMFDLLGPIATSHYKGPTNTGEYSLQNTFDNTVTAQGTSIQTLKWNNQQALVEAPQTRYSFFGSGKWEFNDDVTFFTRVGYAESKTSTRLIPTNASFGWEANVPYDPNKDSPYLLKDPVTGAALDYGDPATLARIKSDPTLRNPNFIAHGQAGAQHPITNELALLLNSRGRMTYCLQGGAGPTACPKTVPPTLVPTTDPALAGKWTGSFFAPNQTGTWIAETYPNGSFPQRATLNTNNVWQIETGFDFKLPVKDWTGELYWSRGQSSSYNNAYGNNSLTRWRALVSAPDYGRNSTLFGNGSGASPNFGTVPVPCTSGFYETLFNGDAVPSADCQYAAEAILQTRTQNQQDVGELNFQGGLFDGWAGEVRGALGVQYRKNAAQFMPDILQSTASFTDQVIGVYPTGPLDASMNAKDYYVEFLVPVLADKLVKKVELELGGRQSDYSVTKSAFTFKINSNVEVNDWVRFRGGFNRATRSPNLGELYLNLQEIFTLDGRFGDPCGVRSNAPFGAGGSGIDPNPQIPTPPKTASGQTAAGALSTRMICQAQMGGVGSQAENTFYGPNGNNAPAATGGTFNWVYQEGNSNLEQEKANTWTAGVVFQSRAQNAWLSGLSAAVDWWKVDIKDAIQLYSIDYARYLCYGTVQVTTAAEAAAQAATDACKNVPRNTATGAATTMLLKYDNQATIATSGIDLQLNWLAALSDLGFSKLPGRVGMNIQASFLDYYKTKQSPQAFDAETDWKGSLGPTLTGTNPGAYSYRLHTGLSYTLPSWNFNLRWRHLPSVWPANKATEEAIIKNNERVAAGGEGVILSYTPGTAIKTPSYNVFDLAVTWAMNDKFMIRAGVDNLFDKDPPPVGDNGTNPTASANGARTGYPDPTKLSSVCSPEQEAKGCVDPTNTLLPSSGAGFTSPGFYDVLGRRYFLGFKATF